MKILFLVTCIILLFVISKLIPALFRLFALRAYNAGKNSKALKLYKLAIKFSFSKLHYKTEYSLLLMRMGNFKEAASLLTEIIIDKKISKVDKVNVRAYRAMAYHKMGRNDEALEEMEELFKSTKSSVIYGLLGFLRQLSGKPEVDFCEEAYAYNSDDRDICDNLLVAYIRSGNFQKADEIAKNLREKYPRFVEAFYHSALLEYKKGNKDKAKEYLEKLKECKRSMLTTVAQEEIENLKEEIENA